MTNPVWPVGLPEYVLQQGYGEELQDQNIRTPMEGGAVKTRRRFTARFDLIDVRLIMSSAQVETFETFYYTTLLGGSIVFDWVHPRTQDAKTLQIIGKVRVTPADGDNFNVSMKIEVKP